MSVGPFTFEFIVVFIATLIILHEYGNLRKQHFLVSLAVFTSWFFSFLIIFILPLDVSNTFYLECENNKRVTNYSANITIPIDHCAVPWSHMPSYFLPDLWRVIYWSSQILSWLLLPMMQSYAYAGNFTVWGKIKTALYENALWYGSYLLIFGALLIYVAIKPELSLNAENLKLIGITASNTWGLLMLIFLMGYGLVELPRNAWNMSKPNSRLEQIYFQLSKLSTEKEDADDELAVVLTEVKKASEEIRYNSNNRKYIDTIIDKCPDGSAELFSKGTDDFTDYSRSAGTDLSMQNLMKIHKKVIVTSHNAHRTQVQWNAKLKMAFYLEDVENNKNNPERIFKSSFSDHYTTSRVKLQLLWLWEIQLKPIFFKLLSLVLVVFSVMLVWSETTFFSVNPTLSIFAWLIDTAGKDYRYFDIEVVSCLTIAYMCMCTYYTVFRMKIFNFYYFAPRHQTDANSLLFSGLLLCRLTYALCLNFLAMIHLDGHVTGNTEQNGHKFESETQFTKFMGHMDLLSFVAKGLNVYYPMIVLLVCICTFFSLGKRCLHLFGVEQFLADDDFSGDYVREGKEIVRREKRKAQREIDGRGRGDWTTRSKQIQEKYTKNPISGETSAVSSRYQKPAPNSRIDDSDDDSLIIPSKTSKSKLREDGKTTKYTQFENDTRVDVGYAPTSSVAGSTSASGYENISGSNRTKVPRNIFDDA